VAEDSGRALERQASIAAGLVGLGLLRGVVFSARGQDARERDHSDEQSNHQDVGLALSHASVLSG
jgi:hypothetical protein